MKLPRIDREKSLKMNQLDPILEGAIRSQPAVPGPDPVNPDATPAGYLTPAQTDTALAPLSDTPTIAAVDSVEPVVVRRGPPPAAMAAVVGLIGFAGWMFAGGRRG